jgi:hypothetical protein
MLAIFQGFVSYKYVSFFADRLHNYETVQTVQIYLSVVMLAAGLIPQSTPSVMKQKL